MARECTHSSKHRQPDGHVIECAGCYATTPGPERADVAELVNSKLRQLAAVAAFLDAAKGQPRVRTYLLTDESEPSIELGNPQVEIGSGKLGVLLHALA